MKLDIYYNGKLIHTVIGYQNETRTELMERAKMYLQLIVRD